MMPIPWEDRRAHGLGRAFGRTLVFVARYPTQFFALCRREASPVPAMVFGLVFELVVASLGFVQEELADRTELHATLERYGPELRQVIPGGPELVDQVLRVSPIASLLFTPFGYVLELFGMTAMTWIGLRAIGKMRTSFRTLLRAFAYASWVRIFGLLGATGDVILGALGSLLSFGFASWAWLAAVKQTQEVDTTSAVYASLLGGLAAFVVACVVGLPIVVLLGLWAVSKVQLPTLSP